MIKLRFVQYLFMVATLTVFGLGCSPRAIMADDKTAPVLEGDVQVLTSGPIHEAFAEAVALDPEPGIVVPKVPAALIEEIPPEQKPEGDVQWIPGYWAWDDEMTEYIWVSGIWRVPPPGRQWIPGYWNPVKHGNQWISGYWASVKAEEMEYLPEPPESVEVGPSSNSPSPDYTWIPGCWIWHYGRYVWQPGYWDVAHPDWIWVPSHHIWTPRGYIFVDGYWDYTVIHRGVLFAPVFFPSWVHLGLSFSFSPGFVIDLNIFDDVLFLRPRYGHYYYGDYYASRHYSRGIYPWFSLHARRVVYDPIYAHQRWHHRNEHEWEKHLETRFRKRREHKALRPPRSFDRRTGPGKAGRAFVIPLHRAGKTKAGAYRFKPLSEKERRGFSKREKDVRTYQKKRQSRETLRQKPAVRKQKPEVRKQKPEVRKQKPEVRKQKPAVRKQKPDAREQQPDVREQQPDVREQQPDVRGQQPDVRGQQPRDKVQKSGNSEGRWEDRMQKPDDRLQRGGDGRKRWNER